jgi:hypothetical protein
MSMIEDLIGAILSLFTVGALLTQQIADDLIRYYIVFLTRYRRLH